MAKIYKNFEDLVEQNKGLFQVILKTGNVNILEAIWNARQTEIDFLKSDNLKLNNQTQELENLASENQAEIEDLKTQREILYGEVVVLKNMIDSGRKVQDDLKHQVYSLKEKNKAVETQTTGRILEHESALRERDLLVARFKKLDSDHKLLNYQFKEFRENCDREMRENISIFENVMIERENFKKEAFDLSCELKNLKISFSNLQINYDKSRDLLAESKKTISLKESEIKRINSLKESEIKQLSLALDKKNNELNHFVTCFADFQKKLTGSAVRRHIPEINQ